MNKQGNLVCSVLFQNT